MALRQLPPNARLQPLAVGLAAVGLAACGGDAPLPAGDVPFHLEEHAAAALVASAAPDFGDAAGGQWIFDDGNVDSGTGDWRPLGLPTPGGDSVSTLARTPEALRLGVRPPRDGGTGPITLGGMFVELEDSDWADWESILVTARTEDRFFGIVAAFAVVDDTLPAEQLSEMFNFPELPPVFNDGAEHTYTLPIERPASLVDAPLSHLAIVFVALEPAEIEILEVAMEPSGAAYPDPYGVRIEQRGHEVRRALYTHTPTRLDYVVEVPEGGRLDLGLGVTRPERAVEFSVTLDPDGAAETLLSERHDDPRAWHQRSIDLSAHAGTTVTLSLEASAEQEGTVALWGSPTLSGAAKSSRPNVIFYVIDGAGADFMSIYDYNRRTTPFMERLAQEGALFERAYTNATWTQPSTVSFMTSLQHSVFGGHSRGVHSSPAPTNVRLMSEHFHDAGYVTADFTTNPNSSRMVGLGRGVDVLRDAGPEDSVSTSSLELHEQFLRFREQYPGAPYWVHFQTTDVHEPHEPVPPFAGTFVSPGQRQRFDEAQQQLFSGEFEITSVYESYDRMITQAGIDRHAYYDTMRGLYDETMAHQDYRLSQFVAGLKATGEWENTILVIGSDHGHPAGTFVRFGRGLLEPTPPDWEGALLGSFNTRIPLLVVWPGRIEGGQRFSQPVSMLDVLPTVLDLAGLPMPEIMQGQSLAPLLLGEPGWEDRPVILDEFRFDGETGEWTGNIEMIDGRWGASLEIAPVAEGADPKLGRHAIPAGGRWGATHPYFPEVPRLLLYDLWSDPLALHSVNDRHPDLVVEYTERLQAQWEAHQLLATRVTAGEEQVMSPDQLRTLRALGYIR